MSERLSRNITECWAQAGVLNNNNWYVGAAARPLLYTDSRRLGAVFFPRTWRCVTIHQKGSSGVFEPPQNPKRLAFFYLARGQCSVRTGANGKHLCAGQAQAVQTGVTCIDTHVLLGAAAVLERNSGCVSVQLLGKVHASSSTGEENTVGFSEDVQ